jgi:hypothetical protein
MLSDFYNKSIEQAKAGIEKKYKFCSGLENHEICSIAKKLPPSCKPCSHYWKVEITIPSLQDPIQLIVAVPDRFPDYFPKIYLPELSFKQVWPIPHLEINGALCARSDDTTALNDHDPDVALIGLLDIAVETVIRGLNKENLEDYEDEYLAYWNEKIELESVMSILNSQVDPAFCELFRVVPRLFGMQDIFAYSEDYARKWLMPFRITSLQSFGTAIYLPVDNYLPLSADTNIQVLDFLQKSLNVKSLQVLQNYFNKNLPFYVLICSRLFKGKRTLFAFRIGGWQKVDIKGFSRKSKIPIDVLLKDHKLKDRKINRIKLLRLDRDFLFSRVSYG